MFGLPFPSQCNVEASNAADAPQWCHGDTHIHRVQSEEPFEERITAIKVDEVELGYERRLFTVRTEPRRRLQE